LSGKVAADGAKLLKDLNGANVGSANLVRTAGNEALAEGGGGYSKDNTVDLDPVTGCPKAGFTDADGQKYRVVTEEEMLVQKFYDATDSSFGQCIQRALNYHAKQIGHGGGGPDVYRSSVPLRIANLHDNYTSNIPIDVISNVHLHGDGGFDGPNAFGGTRIHFLGCDGFRLQAWNTTDRDTVGPRADGRGSARCKLSGLMLTSDMTVAGTIAIVQRCIADIDDIYGRNWTGPTIRAWTGNYRGGTYGGNVSTSRWNNIKGEITEGTLSVGGTDSNLCLSFGIQGYQNARFGIEDGNAAGANKHTGAHMTYNGFNPPAGGPFVFCSQSGNIYTPNIGCVDFSNQATLVATLTALLNAHAPSGTTADNSYWYYVGPGGVSAAAPAYASGGPWTFGGDMLCMTPYATEFDSCYMEGGGGLSQSLYRQPTWLGGTVDRTQLRGGTFIKATDDALEIIRSTGLANLILRGSNAGGGQLIVKDMSDNLGWFLYHAMGGGSTYYAASSHQLQVAAALIAQVASFGIELYGGKALYNNGNQVVGARGAALPADATDLASVIVLANAIKARLKATGGHGLVAD
jgi:hypothetical protein